MKNLHFLEKNLDFLVKNLHFLIKNVHLNIKLGLISPVKRLEMMEMMEPRALSQ